MKLYVQGTLFGNLGTGKPSDTAISILLSTNSVCCPCINLLRYSFVAPGHIYFDHNVLNGKVYVVIAGLVVRGNIL